MIIDENKLYIKNLSTALANSNDAGIAILEYLNELVDILFPIIRFELNIDGNGNIIDISGRADFELERIIIKIITERHLFSYSSIRDILNRLTRKYSVLLLVCEEYCLEDNWKNICNITRKLKIMDISENKFVQRCENDLFIILRSKTEIDSIVHSDNNGMKRHRFLFDS